MRLVAAAKVRRAQEQVLRSRPFADRLARVLENLQSQTAFEAVDAPLLEQRELKTVTLVSIAGDRGLCGGYNANVIKRTEERHRELTAKGLKVNLLLVGRKVSAYFGRRDYHVVDSVENLEQVPTAAEADHIASRLLPLFQGRSSDRVEGIYTKFINLVSSRPVVQTLLPLDPQGIATVDDEMFRLTSKGGAMEVERRLTPQQPAQAALRHGL